MTRDERGLTQSVQYAVILPTLMLVTLGVIQSGVWISGHNAAVRAANAGADIASGSYGQTADAESRAVALATAGGLSDVTVSVHRSAASVDVTVAAAAPLILDLGLGRILETASAPVERVTHP